MPSKKPNCVFEMLHDRIGFRQIAIILAMILYIQLHREIGLNSSKETGASDLGIIARKVVLKGS